jgi:hypothetical protein
MVVGIGGLIYTLPANRLGTFFSDTTETLQRKLALDGQHWTKMYMTTAAARIRFPYRHWNFRLETRAKCHHDSPDLSPWVRFQPGRNPLSQ